MLYCKLCLSEYPESDIDEYSTNTSQQIKVFQCDQCFYIKKPIKIHNFNDPCPICLKKYKNKYKNKYVYNECNHWICAKCYYDRKIEKNQCCLCKKQSGTKIVPSIYLCQRQQSECFDNDTPSIKNKDSKYNYFRKLDYITRKCFKQLYIQINDSLGSSLNISLNNNVLYFLCIEYHKFLKLLVENNNNNNVDKLSPSYYINQIWREHIINISNYITVCNIMCGFVLHYYPEKSFLVNNPTYTERFDRTITLYQKKFGNIHPTLFEIWKPLPIYYDNKPRKQYQLSIIVKQLDASTITIDIKSDSLICDIKKIIAQKTNCHQHSIQLILYGKPLADNKTVSYYGIQCYSILHYISQPIANKDNI